MPGNLNLPFLRRLVCSFDFSAELRGANYAQVPDPFQLHTTIDGFLNQSVLLSAEDVEELQELQTVLQQRVMPAYQAGQKAAHAFWTSVTPEERAQCSQFMPADVVLEARRQLPSTLDSEFADWFMEGFCRTWWATEFFIYALLSGYEAWVFKLQTTSSLQSILTPDELLSRIGKFFKEYGGSLEPKYVSWVEHLRETLQQKTKRRATRGT